MQGIMSLPAGRYFSNDEEDQNKAAELVGYIFPTPLNQKKS